MKTTRKCTEEEINRLFQFAKGHYIHFYELQVEFVDHMASGIEALWEEQPDLLFAIAIRKVYRSLGVFGWTKIAASRQKAMYKQFQRKLWGQFFRFFAFPQLLGTLILFLGILLLIQWFGANSLWFGLIGYSGLLIWHERNSRKYNKLTQKRDRAYLWENAMQGVLPITNFVYPYLSLSETQATWGICFGWFALLTGAGSILVIHWYLRPWVYDQIRQYDPDFALD